MTARENTADLYAQRRALRDQITAIDATLDAMAFDEYGLRIGQIVEYKGKRLELYGVELILQDVVQFKGWLILKDGTVSRTTRIIYEPQEIIK